jgi:hypothetical protein
MPICSRCQVQPAREKQRTCGVCHAAYHARVAAAACECSTWNNFAWNGTETKGAGPAGKFERSGELMGSDEEAR